MLSLIVIWPVRSRRAHVFAATRRPLLRSAVGNTVGASDVDLVLRWGCPGRCCKSEGSVAPPEPVGSGCRIHEEEHRREEGYASIDGPGSPESSRDGGGRVGGGDGLRGGSEQLRQVLPDCRDRSASGASAGGSGGAVRRAPSAP